MRTLSAALVAGSLACACGIATNGTGEVAGTFSVPGCRTSGDRAASRYAFVPERFMTERFEDTLIIALQRYPVQLEEADVLTVRLGDLDALRTTESRPLVLPLGLARGEPNLALSLFRTCPSRPTLRAKTGTITFTRFTIAEQPEDTGQGEVLGGTLEARLIGADPAVEVGTLSARFEFTPPRRPLSDSHAR